MPKNDSNPCVWISDSKSLSLRSLLNIGLFLISILSIIIDGLKNEGYVKIHNFGSFKVVRKKSRIGRNPKTMEDVMISERNVLKFKSSKMILDYINKHNDT